MGMEGTAQGFQHGGEEIAIGGEDSCLMGGVLLFIFSSETFLQMCFSADMY